MTSPLLAFFAVFALPATVLAAGPTSAAADRPTDSRPATQPVKVVFDTDMDSDCDDVGALAVLHALADRGECQILATVVSTKNPASAACVDGINTYYGRPDLPIGAPKGEGTQKASKYAAQIAAAFPHDLRSGDDAPDAREVYRRVLSAEPDGCVTLVTVGYLTNVADLLKDPAGPGRLSGVDLVRAKVARWVCMGGNFVGRPAKDDLKLGNNNFTYDKAASLYAVRNWPVDLVFVGREIGSVPSGLKAGARLKELPATSPIRRGYELYFGGQAKDRHVADQTTVLYAVRGLRDYWAMEPLGRMDLQPDMTFAWEPSTGDANGAGGRHRYLLKRTVDGKPNDRQVERAIEDLMLQPPRPRQ
jgi:hypothetical protein